MIGIEDIHGAGDAVMEADRKTGRLSEKTQFRGLGCRHNIEGDGLCGRIPCENNQVAAGIVERPRGEESRASRFHVAFQYLPETNDVQSRISAPGSVD